MVSIPTLTANGDAKRWGRAIFAFSAPMGVEPNTARRDHIAAYVRFAPLKKPCAKGGETELASNATVQQRITSLRLYFDFLVQEQSIGSTRSGRDHHVAGASVGGIRHRGLIPRHRKLPWIPGEDEWAALLPVVRAKSIRHRVMFCLAYCAKNSAHSERKTLIQQDAC
jgi:integrase/recombinase XerD